MTEVFCSNYNPLISNFLELRFFCFLNSIPILVKSMDKIKVIGSKLMI